MAGFPSSRPRPRRRGTLSRARRRENFAPPPLIPTWAGNAQTNVLGHFGDFLVPLHGYRFLGDLRSDNPYWNITSKVADEQHVYCGPGLWYDLDTGRIHIRLAHTKLPGLGEDNYRGEADPRKLPLIIAGFAGGPVLSLESVRHVRLQDLVLRRGRRLSTSRGRPASRSTA